MNDTLDTAERERQWRVLRAASHDIRGPLANVRSYASLLSDPRMELSEKARRSVEVIIRNADRALLLLREFIDSEQVTRGRLELPLEAVDLRGIWAKAVKAVTPLMEERKLRLELDEQVAAAVQAEAGALEHILRVVLEHALSRSPEGGTVSVEIQPLPHAELSIAVTDRGPPLTGEEQEQLFDREAWLEKQRKLSLGFRLSLAQAEARTMGGTLEVSSTTGGTTLELRLPIAAT
ncbi:MAG: HAMP domain-containing histidine kinase [Myxococcota bacterium]|nr:HAMP domain-containing histidine kinase [Myxococcota bacterium]